MLKVIEIFRTRDELDKLVNLPNPRYKSGIRNRAILSVLCYAGLRVSELLNLKVSDVKEKKPIRGIQKQLGHTSLNTTQIYLDYFDDDRKKDFGDFNSSSNFDINNKIKNLYNELENIKNLIKSSI